MSELKIGTLAIIKTTEEPVFVLQIEAAPETEEAKVPEGLTAKLVTVRRPKFTVQEGRVFVLEHNAERYFIDELEPMADFKSRQRTDMMDMKKTIFGEAEEIDTSDMKAGFNA